MLMKSISFILITSANKKESLRRLSFASRQCQNPGMNEYPIETANRDAFTLLNSKLLCIT